MQLIQNKNIAKKKYFDKILYILLLIVFFSFFILYNIRKVETLSIRDFSEILASKELIAIIPKNTVNYFAYKGEVMGFYLEMLQNFAKKYELELKILTDINFLSAIKKIDNNTADIYANNKIFYLSSNVSHTRAINDIFYSSWIVNKNSKVLLDSLNNWIFDFKQTQNYQELYLKYIIQNRFSDSKYYSEKNIHQYDDLIKKYSEVISWDWRLLSSLIYQESHFDPEAVSYAGAKGLMQMMPTTYSFFSEDTLFSIESQLLAGVKYIDHINSIIPQCETDSITRLKITLAIYNLGPTPVINAINKIDKDSVTWCKVSFFLKYPNSENYMIIPENKKANWKNNHAVEYANEIYERYLHYKNLFEDAKLF